MLLRYFTNFEPGEPSRVIKRPVEYRVNRPLTRLGSPFTFGRIPVDSHDFLMSDRLKI